MTLAATDPGSTGPFLPYALAVAVTMLIALPLLVLGLAVLWHKVVLPALLRGDDRMCDAVEAMSQTSRTTP